MLVIMLFQRGPLGTQEAHSKSEQREVPSHLLVIRK